MKPFRDRRKPHPSQNKEPQTLMISLPNPVIDRPTDHAPFQSACLQIAAILNIPVNEATRRFIAFCDRRGCAWRDCFREVLDGEKI